MNLEKIQSTEFFKDQSLKYAFDSLTKVVNRDLILNYLRYLIKTKTPFTICLCDIDNFKHVNDNFGHMKGDEVLETFGAKIEEIVGNDGIVGRYGGDEFIIVLEGITEYNDVWRICHNINMTLPSVKLSFSDVSITLTTGISRFPIDGKTFDDILSTADKALYRGKKKGRNCFIIYLAAKHANILLKTENEVTYSSMDMHSTIFDILTREGNYKDNIVDLFEFFSSYFMYDHLCIQTNDEILYSKIHQLSPTKDFKVYDPKLFENDFNSIGLLYLNNRSTLIQLRNRGFHEELEKQNVFSTLLIRLGKGDKFYGYLRADQTSCRVWQNGEMDLLFTAAKLIEFRLNTLETADIKELLK